MTDWLTNTGKLGHHLPWDLLASIMQTLQQWTRRNFNSKFLRVLLIPLPAGVQHLLTACFCQVNASPLINLMEN